MTDGIATGWHHALWLLGYLCGLLPVLALTTLLVVLALTIGEQIRHRVRVHRIRRHARRAGRLHDIAVSLVDLAADAGAPVKRFPRDGTPPNWPVAS